MFLLPIFPSLPCRFTPPRPTSLGVVGDDDDDEVNGVTEKDEESPPPELPDSGLPFGSSPGSMVGWDFRVHHHDDEHFWVPTVSG